LGGKLNRRSFLKIQFAQRRNAMRRQFLLASVAAIALAGPALAAEPAPAPPPVPVFTWTGFYLGGQIGGAWDYDSSRLAFFSPVTGALFDDGFTNKPSGVIGGAHLGYNLQIGQWVAGLEGTVDGTSINGTAADPVSGVAVHTQENIQGSIRAQLGYAFDRVLLYATGGAAFTSIDNTYSDNTGLVTGSPGVSEKISRTRSGWTVGGGIAYAITNNWSIRAEYRYSDFGHYTDYPFAVFVPSLAGGVLFAQHHLTENQVQFGFSYKFDTFAPVPVVAKY
jgi:outer membrane immunogenic protein